MCVEGHRGDQEASWVVLQGKFEGLLTVRLNGDWVGVCETDGDYSSVGTVEGGYDFRKFAYCVTVVLDYPHYFQISEAIR